MQIDFFDFIRSLNLQLANYKLKDEQFDYISPIHDLQHTYRVMMNVLRLGHLLNDKENTKLAFAAAYIHDMARRGDDEEPLHGMRAAEKKIKYLPAFSKEELKKIQAAAALHCKKDYTMNGEIPAMILRDADLLDRFRLNKLERYHYLFKESLLLVEFAQKLINEELTNDVFCNLISRHKE